MSVLEIYNEQIRDLLGEDPAARMDIRQQTDGRIFVPGLNWVQVKSRSDVQEVCCVCVCVCVCVHARTFEIN